MTVRYEAVNAMLLNEFLKEHGKVEAQERNAQEQQSTITALKGAVAQQQMQIEALTAGPQKVNEQLALSKPAPQLVANPLNSVVAYRIKSCKYRGQNGTYRR